MTIGLEKVLVIAIRRGGEAKKNPDTLTGV